MFKVEKRGRKRKAGKRYPSGGLVQEREVLEARVIAFKQPHRQSVPEKVRHDPRAETFFGRLMLNGVVNEKQYQAGILYRRDIQRYRAYFMSDMPDPNPPSIAGFMQPSGGGAGMSESQGDRIKEVYEKVTAVFKFDQKAAKSVIRVAIWDEWPAWIDQKDLDRGLDKLISHYGLTRA